MKKSVILALMGLMCIICQQAWAKDWLIINSDTGNKGIFVVVTTHENNQDITTVLNPGDAGSFKQEPVDVSAFGMPDDRTNPFRQWISTKRDNISLKKPGIYSLYTNLHSPRDVSKAFIVNISPPVESWMGMFNITNRRIRYHFGFLPGTILWPCYNVNGSLNNAQLHTTGGFPTCITDNVHAAVDMGNGTEVFTNKYRGHTDSGLFIVRENPSKEGVFEVTGPWGMLQS